MSTGWQRILYFGLLFIGRVSNLCLNTNSHELSKFETKFKQKIVSVGRYYLDWHCNIFFLEYIQPKLHRKWVIRMATMIAQQFLKYMKYFGKNEIIFSLRQTLFIYIGGFYGRKYSLNTQREKWNNKISTSV